MSQDIKIKPTVKKIKSHRIQKLIRDIQMVERKRGTKGQIEKNKRRAIRLQKKVEALRKVDLEQICSQFNELTDPPSADAIEQALSEAIVAEDPSPSLVDQQHLEGDDFFITDDTTIMTTTTASPLRTNDVKHENDDNRKTVSHHSAKPLSLNSLFLQSLGDDKSVPPKLKNRKGQRARQRMWELKYGKEAKHLKKTARRATSKSQRSQKIVDSDPIHPSWTASKRLKQKAHSIKQFEGTHVVFSDS